MNLPSIKTLRKICPDDATAKAVRKFLVKMRKEIESCPHVLPCYLAHDWLERLSPLLPQFYGVEGIAPGIGRKSPGILYLNSSDSYGTTLLVTYDKKRCFVSVGSWGDIVERGNYE